MEGQAIAASSDIFVTDLFLIFRTGKCLRLEKAEEEGSSRLPELAPHQRVVSKYNNLKVEIAVMNENLLSTKLMVPAVNPDLVQRDRLFTRLDPGLAQKLTLVSAPAGFGKTSLVSAWARTLDVPVGWLSLDGSDNDPSRFLKHFQTALQNIYPSLAAQDLSSPDAIQAAPVELAATPLINALTAVAMDGLLILDDYHLIDQAEIHAFITYLLEHLPVHIHLALLTRADPPLPLSRLRARGHLTEIRAADLRFTPDEVREFMRLNTDRTYDERQITDLQSKTEGWAAGLKLAVLSLRNHEDVSHFIKTFSGNQEYVAGYLTDEVLAGLPDHVQTFLLQTSILDRMTGELCEQVTGQQTSRETLEHLVRENLFVESLDEGRHWYRYHPLFADLLRQRLRYIHPDSISGLHRQASLWYQQNNMMAAAIDHALAAKDYEQAAQLIEQEAIRVLKSGEVVTLLHWLDRLPDHVMSGFPGLCAYEAYARLFNGQPLHAVIARVPQIGDIEHQPDSRLLTTHALLAVFQGRVGDAICLAEQALATLPEQDTLLQGLALWSLSVGRFLQGDDGDASQLLEEIIQLSTVTNNTATTALALCSMAKLRMREGKLQYAYDLYQRALDLASFPQGRLYMAGQPLIGLGMLDYEWNEWERAARHLSEGVELAQHWGAGSILDGYFSLAFVRQHQGNTSGAEKAIHRAKEIALRFDVTEVDDFLVGYHQAKLWLLQGEYQAAQHWIDGRLQARQYQADDEMARHLRVYEDLFRAWLLIATGDAYEALEVLDHLSPSIEKHSSLIEYHLLHAMACWDVNNLQQAISSLDRALVLAEPGGYIRTLLDKGAIVHELLRVAHSETAFPEFVQRLLAVEETIPSANDSLVEPLSDRELEVLSLICAGKSNQQIADELIIAIGTVKAHVSNIYGKLGVSNRAQAVLKAQELSLP